MSDKMVDAFTEEEYEVIKQFQLTSGPPPDPTNKYADNDQVAVFGQQLFFEKSYAGKLTIADPVLDPTRSFETGLVACASCHDVTHFYVDTRSRPNNMSLGVKWTTRNAPSLVNVAYYRWFSWGGKEDSLWYQGANGCESGVNFGGNRLQYAHMIYVKYRTQYNLLFDPDLDPALDPADSSGRFPANGAPGTAGSTLDNNWKSMTDGDRDAVNKIMANIGKAIEAYERKLISRNAPIDKYLAGDREALTPAQKRGLRLFIGKAACVDCHSGPTFTDNGFHNTGVPQAGINTPVTDNGRFDEIPKTLSNNFNTATQYSDDPDFGKAKLKDLVPNDELLKGKFRTAMLRQIEMTGPYMHTGNLQTLEDVVRFYNWGGGSAGFAGTKSSAMVPLLLTDDEQADLVAFLHALTGEPPPSDLGKNTASTEQVTVPPVK